MLCVIKQGASKKITNMEWDKFWSTNKKKYEPTAHRYMGVFKDTCVELHIENAPAEDVVSIPVALHPKVSCVLRCCFVCRHPRFLVGRGKVRALPKGSCCVGVYLSRDGKLVLFTACASRVPLLRQLTRWLSCLVVLHCSARRSDSAR